MEGAETLSDTLPHSRVRSVTGCRHRGFVAFDRWDGDRSKGFDLGDKSGERCGDLNLDMQGMECEGRVENDRA